MRTGGRILAAVVVVLSVVAVGPPPADAAETRVHHLAINGWSDALNGDVYAGRALDDTGYNRNVVYTGYTSTEWPPSCLWTSGTFRLIDRDGSQLRLRLVPDYRPGACFSGITSQSRSGPLVVLDGTGRWAGATGTGEVTLHGTVARMEGDLVVNLD